MSIHSLDDEMFQRIRGNFDPVVALEENSRGQERRFIESQKYQ